MLVSGGAVTAMQWHLLPTVIVVFAYFFQNKRLKFRVIEQRS
jgi:hypothetical protein